MAYKKDELTEAQWQAMLAMRGKQRSQRELEAKAHYNRRRANIRARRQRAGKATDRASMEKAIGKLALPVDPLLPPDQNNFYVYNQEYIFPDGKVVIRQIKSFKPIDERELEALMEDYWQLLKTYENQEMRRSIPGGKQVYTKTADMEAQRNNWPVPFGPAMRVAG